MILDPDSPEVAAALDAEREAKAILTANAETWHEARQTLFDALRRNEAGILAGQLRNVAMASEAVREHILTEAEVCQALGISPRTYFRRLAELRERLDGQGSAAAQAAGDQVDAAARDSL